MRRALALILLATPCAAQELQPEPSIQEQLGKVTAVLNQSTPLHLNVAAIKELNSLYQSVTDKHDIVEQVAVFSTGPGEQQPLVALAIIDLLRLPPEIVIPVLAPHLDAENPKLRSFVRDWFQGHDNGGPGYDPLKPVNFEDYVKYMQEQKGNVPEPFVEYIYGRSPGRALIVFYRAIEQRSKAIAAVQAEKREIEAARQGLPIPKQQRRQQSEEPGIFLAEQIISHAARLKNWEKGKLLPEAKEQLATLAEHQEWWVRLYVAEIMRRHPELRQDDVLEKLRRDDNRLVSKAASVGS
jgi:hypothetical protein